MTATRIHVHTSTFGLRFADMDALGHVNNAAYFTFMEQARLEWLEKHAPNAFKEGAGPVIANASCTYRIPLVYPRDVEVRMYLGTPGRSSIDSYYEIIADGTTYADGAAKMVWIDLKTGKSTPLPDRIAGPLRTLAKEDR
jgi:acyl-CoA thioester hydrolase